MGRKPIVGIIEGKGYSEKMISRSIVSSYESRSLEASLLLENGELEEAVEKLYLLASNGHVESMKKLGQLLVQNKDSLASYGGYDEGIHWLREAAYCYDNEAIDAIKQLTGKRARVYNHFRDQLIYLMVVSRILCMGAL